MEQLCPDGACVIGVFEDRLAAERAVSDLEDAGFSGREIGFALRGSDVVRGGIATDAVGTKDGAGAAKGMVAGGVTGGILGAAAALLVPGAGPFIAAGILTTALGASAAGAAVGGMLGAMSGLGVSEEEALFYENELKCGRAIVAIRNANRAQKATEILRAHGGYDVARCRDAGTASPGGGGRADDLHENGPTEPPTHGVRL